MVTRPKKGIPVSNSCLYVKIYLAEKNHDAFLRVFVRRVFRLYRKKALCNGIFFVRYADPESHIRLRILGSQDWLIRDVYTRIQSMFSTSNIGRMVRRVSFDKYVPERSRYGGAAGLRLCHDLFTADTALCLEAMSTEIGKSVGRSRNEACVVFGETLLKALHLGSEERVKVYSSWNRGAQRDVCSESALSTLYSLLRNSMRPHFWGGNDMRKAVTQFENDVSAIGVSLRRLARQRQLTKTIPKIAGSVLHMQANRLGIAPVNELILRNLMAGALRRMVKGH